MNATQVAASFDSTLSKFSLFWSSGPTKDLISKLIQKWQQSDQKSERHHRLRLLYVIYCNKEVISNKVK